MKQDIAYEACRYKEKKKKKNRRRRKEEIHAHTIVKIIEKWEGKKEYKKEKGTCSLVKEDIGN